MTIEEKIKMLKRKAEEEAIKRLKLEAEERCDDICECKRGELSICDCCKVAECYDVAIVSIEKQIPKKPEEYWDGYSDGYPVIEYKCPCCGRDIDDTEHHCVCGQTIDWSEEE